MMQLAKETFMKTLIHKPIVVPAIPTIIDTFKPKRSKAMTAGKFMGRNQTIKLTEK